VLHFRKDDNERRLVLDWEQSWRSFCLRRFASCFEFILIYLRNLSVLHQSNITGNWHLCTSLGTLLNFMLSARFIALNHSLATGARIGMLGSIKPLQFCEWHW